MSGLLRGGAAQRAGVEVGDEVVMIGDARVEGVEPVSMCRAIARSRKAGGNLQLRLRRDGAEYSVELPRAESLPPLADRAE